MSFEVELTPEAEEDLKNIEDSLSQSIVAKSLKKLENSPREHGVRYSGKLSDYYKLRAARGYRIIYEIRDVEGKVSVHVIGIRSTVYNVAYRRLVP